MGKSNWRSFEEARAFVHNLQLKDGKEWIIWARSENKPNDIPTYPDSAYKNQGWISLGDWLGTGTVAHKNRTYRSFEKARAFVHNLQIKNKNEWAEWSKTEAKPEDIPADPRQIYKDKGWNGWGDWLGTGAVAAFNRAYRSFEEARIFVHSP